MADADYVADTSLNEKWRTRFAFFDRFGGPSSPQYKEELKKLPFRQKMLINTNIWAFFFGPIYLAILGLWKKALSMLGMLIVVSFLLGMIGVPDAVFRGIGVAFSMLYMILTNYAYYLKKVKGQDGWNPFEGMRL